MFNLMNFDIFDLVKSLTLITESKLLVYLNACLVQYDRKLQFCIFSDFFGAKKCIFTKNLRKYFLIKCNTMAQ